PLDDTSGKRWLHHGEARGNSACFCGFHRYDMHIQRAVLGQHDRCPAGLQEVEVLDIDLERPGGPDFIAAGTVGRMSSAPRSDGLGDVEPDPGKGTNAAASV